MEENRETSAGREGRVSATNPAGAAALGEEGTARSLHGATAWINSPPLTWSDVRGEVVVVQFWTFSCINWLRTLPFVRAWAAKYRDDGLAVIGVHTPEFGFEHDLDNVRRAAREMNIDYPVAVDSDYAVWRAFDNHYWPAAYFIDGQGSIRGHQFGEGRYEESERLIQQLLGEAGKGGGGRDLVSVVGTAVEAPADWGSLRTPETYVGWARAEHFASPGGAFDEPRAYAIPSGLGPNQWALAGEWTIGREAALLSEPGGRIAFRFHARDLHLVMGPRDRGATTAFRVLVEGEPPGDAAGVDVDERGHGTATDQRLYQLVRQPGPVTDRTLEITFLDAGIEAYVFTFG